MMRLFDEFERSCGALFLCLLLGRRHQVVARLGVADRLERILRGQTAVTSASK
jgi:hypothetical protein